MKRTPWFSCATPPVRPGVYETRMSGVVNKRRRWDGEIWRYFHSDLPCLFFGSGIKDDAWRGLAEKPE